MNQRRGLLVYDDECAFCRGAAAWFERRWPPEPGHRAVPAKGWDNARGEGLGLSPDELRRSAWWIQGGVRDAGARAVARALMGVGGRWALLGRLLLAPPLSIGAGWVYRFVARYRGLLPGAGAPCEKECDSCSPTGRSRGAATEQLRGRP